MSFPPAADNPGPSDDRAARDLQTSAPFDSNNAPLPPVEPPSASFLMQLFFIPMMIVGLVVMVWLMFSWLARNDSDPKKLVDELRNGGPGSWQKAVNLAQMLRGDRNESLRQDRELAGNLAGLLQDLMKKQNRSADDVLLMQFVSRALGEFEVSSGVPILLQAAKRHEQDADWAVQRAAVQGLAVHISKATPSELARHPDVANVLSDLALDSRGVDENPQAGKLRGEAAYALGVLGGDKALDALELVLDDPVPDARFNAATGLARHGDARALPGLREMLAPGDWEEILRGDEYADDHSPRLPRTGPGLTTTQEWKRTLIQLTAIQSLLNMAKEYPSLDLEAMIPALERAASESENPKVSVEAKNALYMLQERK